MGTAKGENKKYIETPDKLWRLFIAYKKEVKDNPRERQDFVGKDGDEITRRIERPLTISGFHVYCAENIADLEAYWLNRDNRYEDYSGIISRIKAEIRADQVEGGLLGDYNSNLTARLNGIKEQTESVSNHNITLMNIDPLSDPIQPIEIEAKDVPKIPVKKKVVKKLTKRN